jgi:hypothetical protein
VADYGEPHRRFQRAGVGPEVWFWTGLGLQASVSGDEVVFIEVLEPAEVVVAGVSVIGLRIDEARSALEGAGAPLHATDDPVVWDWEGGRAGVFLDGGDEGDLVAAASYGGR